MILVAVDATEEDERAVEGMEAAMAEGATEVAWGAAASVVEAQAVEALEVVVPEAAVMDVAGTVEVRAVVVAEQEHQRVSWEVAKAVAATVVAAAVEAEEA